MNSIGSAGQLQDLLPRATSGEFNHEEIDRALNYETRIVAGNSNSELVKDIANILRIPVTDAEIRRFSDGEVFVSIKENVRGKDVFVIQSTCPPVNDHLMELLVIIDTLKRASAKRITAVIPYYGYARQDRKVAPRVPITARLVADLIQTAGAHRILAFELHAGQIQGFFNIPVDHMFAIHVFAEHLRDSGICHNGENGFVAPVVVSPDAGGMERARALAKRLDASLAVIDKRRSAANVAHVIRVVGDVVDRDCIIVDDIVDTAGTLTKAAEALKNLGAARVMACCVHPVLSGPAIERITQSPIDKIIVTNSIPLSEDKLRCGKIEVITVAGLIAQTITRIHREQSVSTLFDG
eukprot:Plantae.Rhodophyta-Purpureofilum_apyrenoidigerum.ctg37894.p1 GENE.Plantae.Rhodophyta-Purpureofilum_apyrenoidigerum.ctg37894~~Plantae.Rhodophyta-Purpureofilum_apyrenoidigerum.ctg37894.p1  ORF type:complete len:353 (+),score=62.44 Plantae.Rhodophyta-Purpureofilum_apyrenoidigerum.ctg37894:162-1220(+)